MAQDLIANLIRRSQEQEADKVYGVDEVDQIVPTASPRYTARPISERSEEILATPAEVGSLPTPGTNDYEAIMKHLSEMPVEALEAPEARDIVPTVVTEPTVSELRAVDEQEVPGVSWDFIEEQEGKGVLKGYVPKSKGKVLDKSGVTIASGFDVGAHNESELRSGGLSESLITKLRPFFGIKGMDADKLPFSKLKITKEEGRDLDLFSRSKTLKIVRDNYKSETGEDFDSLPSEIQTVLASVGFQYGGQGLKSKTPNFWKQMVSKDYTGALKNLHNFGDKYPSRRKREAKYLNQYLKRNT